jgi:hypothetical protein
MSLHAFLWCYRLGENASMPLSTILDAFQPWTESVDSETDILQVQFDGPENSCDIYLGMHATARGATAGISIWQPLNDARLWECILEIMRRESVILFFSDDTTPLYATPEVLAHFSPELLQSLGEPRLVANAQDILSSRA